MMNSPRGRRVQKLVLGGNRNDDHLAAAAFVILRQSRSGVSVETNDKQTHRSSMVAAIVRC